MRHLTYSCIRSEHRRLLDLDTVRLPMATVIAEHSPHGGSVG